MNSPAIREAYAAELRRRWGGLLSYRYIGRIHASMDNGEADETVTLRRDMRNPTGGLLLAVLGIASPDSGGVSDLEAVPNPVIHSCQILDPDATSGASRSTPRCSSRGDRWPTAAPPSSTPTTRRGCWH